MINLFLRAKHWHLFLLMFVVPMLMQATMMGNLVAQASNDTDPQSFFSGTFFIYIGIIVSLFLFVHFAWLWSMAFGLQRYISPELKLNLNKFSLAFYFPLIYILFFMTYIFSFFPSGSESFDLFFIIIPFHLLAMFCMFYCLYFIAKSLKTAELQRRVTFSDYVGEFAMVWFYPIGIWFIQPKLNAFVNNEHDSFHESLDQNLTSESDE